VDPQPVTGTTAWQDTLPRNSLTIYSTYKLDHDMPGVMAETEVPEFAIEPNQVRSFSKTN
jgi:hypothetical protein